MHASTVVNLNRPLRTLRRVLLRFSPNHCGLLHFLLHRLLARSILRRHLLDQATVVKVSYFVFSYALGHGVTEGVALRRLRFRIMIHFQVRRSDHALLSITPYSTCLLRVFFRQVQRIMVGRVTGIHLVSSRSRNAYNTGRIRLVLGRLVLSNSSIFVYPINVVNFCTRAYFFSSRRDCHVDLYLAKRMGGA